MDENQIDLTEQMIEHCKRMSTDPAYRDQVIAETICWSRNYWKRMVAVERLQRLRVKRPDCPLYQSIPFDPLEINLLLDKAKEPEHWTFTGT